MTSCESMEPILAAYLAGEAAARERVRAEAHLLDCAECREMYAQAKAGWEAASDWALGGAAPAIVLPARPSRAVRILRLVTAVAAGVMIASLFMRPAPGPVPTPARAEPPRVAAYVPPSGRAAVGTLACVDPESKKPVGELAIASLRIEVEVRDGVAQTTVEEIFTNHTDRRLEGTFVFPLPPDAAITRLAMEIDGKLVEGECVEREKARETYEGIVRKMKDPALLEWMPGGLFRCRIFPIEAKSDKRIILSWQQVLPSLDGRMQYVYPLVSETTAERTIGRFAVTARVAGATMASPSHAFVDGTFAAAAYRATTDVVLDLEAECPEFVAVAHTGHVACLIAPRPDAVERARVPAGTVFVVDCSASVSEAELEVARKLVERMIDALPGGSVQVIGHNVLLQTSERTTDRAVAKAFLTRLTTGGGSDVGLALAHAMRAAPEGGEVVYVGEGAPTVGETDVAKLIARARENAEGREVTFRAVAVGSGADRGTLGALASAFHGGVHAIAVTDDVERRVAEIVRTLGRPAMTDVRLSIEGTEDAAPASIGSLYFGERAIVAARIARPGASKAVLTARVHGREIRREWAVELPAEESKNLWVKRLWAQRRVADLIPKGEGARAEIVSIGISHQLMTPHTSFLVLENERAYEEHKLERTKKERETLVKGEKREAEQNLKREVHARVAKLLELAYMAFDQRKFDRVIQVSNEILYIDPRYHVALELKEDAEKARHREEYYGFLRKKIDNWKALADASDEAVIPYAETVRTPTQQEWDEITKRVSESVVRGDPDELAKTDAEARKRLEEAMKSHSVQDQQRISESDQYRRRALAFKDTGELDKAKDEAMKAVERWPGNLEARKLLADVNALMARGRRAPVAQDQLDEFKVKVEQAQMEITNHVRQGERFYAVREYESALREFEQAEFKIKSIPYDLHAMKELLPKVSGYIGKARDSRALERARVDEMKRREAESEADPRELARKREVVEAQQSAEADEHYRLAERWYQAGDYDRAEIECMKAMQMNPDHAPANALMLETHFQQGKGQATPAGETYQKLIQESLVRHQQVLLEIDDKLTRATRSYNGGYYQDAERDLRAILEYAKWLPTSSALDALCKQTRDMLEKATAARGRDAMDADRVSLQMLQEEKARDEIRKRIETKRELEILFGQAQLFFEQQRYDRAAEICDRILYVNPNIRSVDEMREVARRFTHAKSDPKQSREYLDEWKRTFELVELPAVIQADALSFPAREMWEDAVSKRRPKGIQDFELEEPAEQLKRDYARLLQELGSKERRHAETLADIEEVRTPSQLPPSLFRIRIDLAAPIGAPVLDDYDIQIETAAVPPDPTPDAALRIANLQRAFDAKNANVAKLVADTDVYVRQMEVQLTQLQEMSNKMEEYRSKLARSAAERSTASQELQYARQELEMLQKSMGALEEQHIQLARDKKRLEETIASLSARGVDTDLVSPKKLLEGKVTAVSPEIGLTVISIGRDDGVLEGNEFTVFRSGQFIAKITVERVDRKWAAGRVTLKKDDPKVGDDVSNSVFIGAHSEGRWTLAPIDIHIVNAPLEAIVAALRDEYRVTLIVDPAARAACATRASLHATGLDLDTVLRALLESRGLVAVRQKSGAILVTVPERLDVDALERKTADTLRKLQEMQK